MLDERLKKLGDHIIDYSCSIKKGDKVLIEATKNSSDFMIYLMQKCYERGALPFYILNESYLKRELILNGSSEQFDLLAEKQRVLMEKVDAYIEITEYDNWYEMTDIPIEKRIVYQKHFNQPVYKDKTSKKWTTVAYPSKSMAQRFGMSTASFLDYYFSVMNLDYQELSYKMDKLKKLMDKSQKVSLKGNSLDLSFTIKNQPSFICDGKINLPDGEVFIAPDKYSAEGYVKFNVDALYQGYNFSDIEFEFKKGKIIKANSSINSNILSNIINTDEGSKYIGEFAIGTNPHINKFIGNIMYDEKMLETFHIALGNAHHESDNFNRSAVHWDIVYHMGLAYGKASIYFDNIKVMENGKFLIEELKPLNYDNESLILERKRF